MLKELGFDALLICVLVLIYIIFRGKTKENNTDSNKVKAIFYFVFVCCGLLAVRFVSDFGINIVLALTVGVSAIEFADNFISYNYCRLNNEL